MNELLDQFRLEAPDGWWWEEPECFVVLAQRIGLRQWAVIAKYRDGDYYGGVIDSCIGVFARDYTWGSLEKATSHYMRILAEHNSDRLSQEKAG